MQHTHNSGHGLAYLPQLVKYPPQQLVSLSSNSNAGSLKCSAPSSYLIKTGRCILHHQLNESNCRNQYVSPKKFQSLHLEHSIINLQDNSFVQRELEEFESKLEPIHDRYKGFSENARIKSIMLADTAGYRKYKYNKEASGGNEGIAIGQIIKKRELTNITNRQGVNKYSYIKNVNKTYGNAEDGQITPGILYESITNRKIERLPRNKNLKQRGHKIVYGTSKKNAVNNSNPACASRNDMQQQKISIMPAQNDNKTNIDDQKYKMSIAEQKCEQ